MTSKGARWVRVAAGSLLAAAAAAGVYYVVARRRSARGRGRRRGGVGGDSPRAERARRLIPREMRAKYEVGACLGEGTYAVVFSAALRNELALYNEVDGGGDGGDGGGGGREQGKGASGPEYRFAIKVLPRAFRGSFFAAGFLEKELAILRRVEHPSILSLVDSACTEDALLFATERALGGDLFEAINRHRSYDEKAAQTIFRQLLSAVRYLHEEARIIHRDLKPENILLMEDDDDCSSVRICDFGVSKMWESSEREEGGGGRMRAQRRPAPGRRGGGLQLRTSTVTGTPGYQAPEILDANNETGYGTAVDLWSLGIILYTMLCGYLPERIPPPMAEDDDEVWARVSSEAKDLVRALLSPVPERRPTAREALECSWLRNGTPRRPATERAGKRLAPAEDVHARASSALLPQDGREENPGATVRSRRRTTELWGKVRDRLKLKSKSVKRL